MCTSKKRKKAIVTIALCYSFRYFFVLFTEVKFFNNCSVTVDFSLVKIIKKASTLTN